MNDPTLGADVITWNDVLVELCEMYELLTELIKSNASEPETDFTRMNEENLKAMMLHCQNMIADINDKIAKIT